MIIVLHCFAGVWHKCYGDCRQVIWSTNQV